MEATPKNAFAALAGSKFNTYNTFFGSTVSLGSRPHFSRDKHSFTPGATKPIIAKKSVMSTLLDTMPDMVLINLSPDLFITRYVDTNFLINAIYSNSKILSTLASHGLTVNINREHITRIINSHLIPTMMYAGKIAEYSGEKLSAKENEILLKAALLHDIGKILIPGEIINKKGRLTPEERKIIDLHSELGAEILKASSLEPEVIELVRNHHRHLDSEKKPDKLTQILTIADIYSALREKRAYKDKFENDEIFEIFHDSINNGELGRKYFVALKEYVIGGRVAKAQEAAQQEALV